MTEPPYWPPPPNWRSDLDQPAPKPWVAKDTPAALVGLGAFFGLVSIAAVPLFQLAMGLGLDGTNDEAQLLVVFAFFTGVPLVMGLGLLSPVLSRWAGWRVGVGLLLVTWVAVTGGVIGAWYTSGLWESLLIRRSPWDTALTVGEVGVVPGLIGLILLASGVRGIFRARKRVACPRGDASPVGNARPGQCSGMNSEQPLGRDSALRWWPLELPTRAAHSGSLQTSQHRVVEGSEKGPRGRADLVARREADRLSGAACFFDSKPTERNGI